MTKPNPYCECHKWDQPGGICAYCVGYTDGWTTEGARPLARIESLRAALERVRERGASAEFGSPLQSVFVTAVLALLADDTEAKK